MERKLFWQIQNLTKSELNNIPGHKVRRFCDHRFNGTGQHVYWYECECGYVSAKCLSFNSARARLEADHLTRVYMKLNHGVEW